MSAVIAANPLDHPRIGFAFSKKFSRRAVQRNSLKRLLRERFRQAQHGLQAVDLVIFLRGRLPDQPQAETLAIDALWTKLLAACAKR